MLFGNDKKKVLIVDDDTSLLRQLSFRLKRHEKVDVLLAETGKNGLQEADVFHPDLIILDWTLPDIQGIDVLTQLRKMPVIKTTPILMLTGHNKIGDVEDAFKLGANGYMTKPFSLEKLGAKVSEMLNAGRHKQTH